MRRVSPGLLQSLRTLALLAALATAAPASAQAPDGFAAAQEAVVVRAVQELRAGDLAAAEVEMKAAIALYSDRFGPAAPETLEAIEINAGLLAHFGGTSPTLRRLAYERSEAAFGPQDPRTLGALEWLVLQLVVASAPEAATFAETSVARHRQAFGPDSPRTRRAEIALAGILSETNPWAAIPLLEDLSARLAHAEGEERLGRGLVLVHLGTARFLLGAHAEALEALDAAAATMTDALGPDEPTLGAIDHQRAAVLLLLGRYPEAETVARGGLARMSRTGNPDPSALAALLFDLAQALGMQDRLDEARAVAEDAMLARLQATPTDPAGQIELLGKYSQMLEAFDRPEFRVAALRAILEQVAARFGPDASETYMAMSELGIALVGDESNEARRLLESARAGLARTLGATDAATLRAGARLAPFLVVDGRIEDAVEVQAQYVHHLRATIGPDAEEVLLEQMNLASFVWLAGRPAEAGRLIEDMLGRLSDAPSARWLRHESSRLLARVLMAGDRPAEALALLESERAYALDAFRSAGADIHLPGLQIHRTSIAGMGFWLARAAWLTAAQADAAARGEALRDAAFEDVQLAADGATSDAVFRAAARAAARDPQVRAVFEEWEKLQDASLRRRLDRTDRLARGDGPPAAREDSAGELASLRAALQHDHPELLRLLAPPPTPLARLQGTDGKPALLREDEVLVLVAGAGVGEIGPDADRGLVWAVSRDAAAWAVAPLGGRRLFDEIARLRDQLDPPPDAGPDPLAVAARSPVRPAGLASGGTPPPVATRPFDLSASHALYRALFGDPAIAAVLRDNPTWVIVAQAEALSLPFNALVTRLPPPGLEGAARLRSAGWLGLERGILTLPSVSAFAALREREAEAREPGGGDARRHRYVAFADPDFGTKPLPSLAGTRQEIARVLEIDGIDPVAIALGGDASEARLADLAVRSGLADADIVHFATHGVMVSPADAARPEPALVLSAPRTASVPSADPLMDGYLTASEIAALPLSADWAILSACNTGARLGMMARMDFRGLTDGFLEAGVGNVLVSHWRVRDDIAARLVVDTVAGNLGGLPKAEALRRAMRGVAANTARDGSHLPDAHPSVWAPFLLVGGDRPARDIRP